MTNTYRIRRASSADYHDLALVMFEAVRKGRSEYTKEQVLAWMPEVRSGPDWIARLDSQTIVTCEGNGRIVGFMSLAEAGYIDFAYIHPASQGTGVFGLLYQPVEEIARVHGEPRLWVHASLMARPAFSKVGFVIESEEIVGIRGQNLRRFVMAKLLVQ